MPRTHRPFARRAQARAMKLVNVPMRFALSRKRPTPLSRRLMLLTYTGRRTGRKYRQPLSYVRDNEVLLTPGGGAWTLSLQENQPVTIRLAGSDIHMRPELVSDIDEAQRLIRIMGESNPAVRRFIAIPRTADGNLDSRRLREAIEHGFRVVRWHPAANH
jgi:hypothetical protein